MNSQQRATLKEYWFVGDDLIGVSVPLRQQVNFTINTAFFCGTCGQIWARRMIEGYILPVAWNVEPWTQCPNCPPTRRKRMLKMITYEESVLNNFNNVPTAILVYEFLWLYLAEHMQ